MAPRLREQNAASEAGVDYGQMRQIRQNMEAELAREAARGQTSADLPGSIFRAGYPSGSHRAHS